MFGAMAIVEVFLALLCLATACGAAVWVVVRRRANRRYVEITYRRMKGERIKRNHGPPNLSL
ncbi:hypothetical protein SADO_03310 [Salinisphaera dokdonensis CL-ES53]|uniref:Uncharacterized protein n=2 Tax=Salinisphaera TaxID=180541 RepID=A0ABV2AX77_9GAMM